MIKHRLIQGSPQWHAHRANFFNASDAPAMMGESKNETRAQFLHRSATGIEKERDEFTLALFAEGHRVEALAMTLAEAIVGDELYRVVGSELKLSASFDGCTADGKTIYEHKLINNDYRAATCGADLPLAVRIQMEHQYIVSRAERCLFLATGWDGDECVEKVFFWYVSDPVLRRRIQTGWENFDDDRDAYQVPRIEPILIPAPIMSLPALSIRVDGAIELISNLPVFFEKLRGIISVINFEPATDQDFCDATEQVKRLKEFRKNLKSARESAVAQVLPIDEMNRMADVVDKILADNAKLLESAVSARKEKIKSDAIMAAKKALADHVGALNSRLGKPYMPIIVADFAGSIKGLSKIDSMNEKMTALLSTKIVEANMSYEILAKNLETLRELGGEHKFLFPDVKEIVSWDNSALSAMITNRIHAHEQSQAVIVEAKAEAARQIIREEEAAKAKAAARVAEVAPEVGVELAAQLERVANISPLAAAQLAAEKYFENLPSPVLESAATEVGAEHIKNFKFTQATPTATQIIELLANYYQKDAETVVSWLKSINWAEYKQ